MLIVNQKKKKKIAISLPEPEGIV